MQLVKQVLEGLLKKSTQERMKMDDVIKSAWLEDPDRWFNEHQKTVLALFVYATNWT